ncbi:uncharacterized protein LOC125674321 isoform X2 [Ostrea edulis]|uniref:uncharacterized protein LOC125674321 isoform X2 n=1 Tax=Ostrea edulis TaxID=37623 RepID=UPI0024AF9A95|nr:uncharacterized protein LOC125674321 isoform X2 [Ostrea edulis]XP_055998734.1 uncharacterized protein LOC125674321 isoform X2 [Ostrea edulis]
MGPKKKSAGTEPPAKRRRTAQNGNATNILSASDTTNSDIIQSLTKNITSNIMAELQKVGVLPTQNPQVEQAGGPDQDKQQRFERNTSGTMLQGEQIPASAVLDLERQLPNTQGSRVSGAGTTYSTRTISGTRSSDASKLLEYIEQLTKAAIAPSTKATYNRAWRTLLSFCSKYGMSCELPLSTSLVALFVAHLFSDSFSPRSISTYLSALAYVHKVLNYQDPTQAFVIQKLVAGAYRLGNTFDIRLPITPHILNNLLSCIPQVIHEEYKRKMFRAMFLFAFYAFARIGEIVSSDGHTDDVIQLSDVTFTRGAEKFNQVNVCFRKFKHNSSGQPKYISFSHGPCQISAIDSLVQYLNVRKNNEGPLFILNGGLQLTRSVFNKTLQKCLLCCGLDSTRYKGHSFRIGAATVAAQNGCTDAQIRSVGRWHSNAFQKYIRSNNIPSNK